VQSGAWPRRLALHSREVSRHAVPRRRVHA
jgi:hypothetical protein